MEIFMSRPIVLGNGELHVGLNIYGLVHDFYYPYVGLENHAAGPSCRHRVGVWIDGVLSWLDDEGWTFEFSYPHQALIGRTIAMNEAMEVRLEFDDFVDSSISAFMRNIHVVSLSNAPRQVRLFMHQAFVIGDAQSNTDTAQYLPDSNAVLHYRGRRAFIISGRSGGDSFDQHSIGLFDIEGHEGTYRDADDGELSNSSVEHGKVDSTIRFCLEVEAHGSARVEYWIAAGTSTRDALSVHKRIEDSSITSLMHSTRDWWHTWLKPAITVSEKISPNHRLKFLQSVMIIKSHIDNHGAVIASTDSTLLNYSRDAYAYCWPRDGAYVLWPLIRMGYEEEPRKFFDFCRRGLHPTGYLMHKYQADGALGSSWHSYVHQDGTSGPPIQEDETALTLFVFAQFYRMHSDPKLLNDFYESMIVPMANFMAGYIEGQTGLPKPSFDLWEEVYQTSTYTTSLIYAALLAAAELAESANDADKAVSWRSTAEDIRSAAHRHLFNKDRGSFYKGISVVDDKVIYDQTIDSSSFFGVFMFGLFAPDSPEVKSGFQAMQHAFRGEDTSIIGQPRYENDHYRRTDNTIVGNYWYICSLWTAQYYIEKGNYDQAGAIIDWVAKQSLSTGVLAEQLNPVDNSKVSPAPLTWSQAEYVATLLDTVTES